MLPVIIINGPLGSGKTTLIHTLLQSHIEPTKTLWLKTEFGDESIDEYILQDTQVQTKALTGGCICHVLLSELDGVLSQIEALQDIDQVIIETSGMSHPVPVTQTIERHPEFLVAHTTLVVDVAHVGESNYPRPMVLPDGGAAPYEMILFNKYDTTLSIPEEGELEKVLDPWFAGVYSFIEKLQVPDKTNNESLFTERVAAWAAELTSAMHAARLQSPRHIIDTSAPEVDEEAMEDHEGDMDVLTFHIPADHIVSKKTIETYVITVPSDVVRIKGVFRTGEDTWEFYNWVRGTGNWTPLDVTPAGQIFLVMGHDIKDNKSIQSIDV